MKKFTFKKAGKNIALTLLLAIFVVGNVLFFDMIFETMTYISFTGIVICIDLSVLAALAHNILMNKMKFKNDNNDV